MKQLCSGPVSSTTKALFILFFSVLLFFLPVCCRRIYHHMYITRRDRISTHTHMRRSKRAESVAVTCEEHLFHPLHDGPIKRSTRTAAAALPDYQTFRK